MGDNELKAVRAVCIAVTLIALVIVGGCHFTNRVAITKGLCEGSVPGQNGVYWVPCSQPQTK